MRLERVIGIQKEILDVSFQMSRMKRNLWWPSRIGFRRPFRVSSSQQRAVRDSKLLLVHVRVPGLHIRDCAKGCNNCVHARAQMSAIDVTKMILFERLYLVLGMGTFEPWVNCPYAPRTPTVHTATISRFLCNFFHRTAPNFFGHHDPLNADYRCHSWFGFISMESVPPMSLGLFTSECSARNPDFGLFWTMWEISWLKWVEDLETKGGRLKNPHVLKKS